MQKGSIGREIAVLVAQCTLFASALLMAKYTNSGLPSFAEGFLCWSAVWLERYAK